MRVGDEEMTFNLTKIVRFSDDDKGTCMRFNSLMPFIDDVLHGMIKRDPLEKCLTELLFMNDLELELPFAVQEISETILAINENEDTVVIEKEKKISNGLILKVLPENLCYTFLGEIVQNL